VNEYPPFVVRGADCDIRYTVMKISVHGWVTVQAEYGDLIGDTFEPFHKETMSFSGENIANLFASREEKS
jgi:hypothetical protein